MAKKLFTLLMLFTFVFGVGWAATAPVTVTKTMNDIVAENGYTVSSGSEINTICPSFQLDDIITISTTGQPNCGTFWGTSTIDWRLYQESSGNLIITAAPGYALQSATFTYSFLNSGVLVYNDSNFTNGTPCTVRGDSAVFSIKSTTVANGHAVVRITSISVTYVKTMTLKEMIENQQEADYIISDELQVVKCFIRNDGNSAWMIVKDDGPACEATDMSAIPDNCEDYMTEHVGFNGNWDQSNWVILSFDNLSEQDVAKVQSCEGMRLAANINVYKSNSNGTNIICYANVNDLVIAEDSEPTTYAPNLYCPANFLRDNHNGNATGHDAEGNPTQEHFFFMNPKLHEVCEITDAVWTIRENQYGHKNGFFVLPASDGTNNPANIYGAVWADWSLNNDPIIDPETGEEQMWPEGLEEGVIYRFKALVMARWARKNGAQSPKEAEEHVIPGDYENDDTFYYICPFDFVTEQTDENVVTGIKDVVDVTDKTVAGVKYYNLAGIESERPFEGVNIIVTTYTDGSRSSSKVLK